MPCYHYKSSPGNKRSIGVLGKPVFYYPILWTSNFAGFDLKVNGEYKSTDIAHLGISCELELPHVDVLYEGPWSQEVQDSFVFNNFIGGTKVPHEGIVIKHTSGERHKIAKVINPDYLIYGEKNNVGDSH